MLRPLNPRPPVRSRREALRSVLNFDVVPDGFRDDLLACLALDGRSTSADNVYAAARRLAVGVVDLLAAHAAAFTPLLSRQEAATLRDGTLRRYVNQM